MKNRTARAIWKFADATTFCFQQSTLTTPEEWQDALANLKAAKAVLEDALTHDDFNDPHLKGE
jgi:hypothetical protein